MSSIPEGNPGVPAGRRDSFPRAQLEALYAAYLEKTAALERDRRFGEGLFGTKGPGDDPCHERFAEELRALLEDFAASSPPPEAVRETVRCVLEAPQLHREPKTAYWMLIAVQSLTAPLIPLLRPEDAAALRASLEKAYPRYARMPAQNELLRRLKERERA